MGKGEFFNKGCATQWQLDLNLGNGTLYEGSEVAILKGNSSSCSIGQQLASSLSVGPDSK